MTAATRPVSGVRALRESTPPRPMWSEMAEQAVLAAMLFEPKAILTARQQLTAGDFFTVPHQTLFTAILAVADVGATVDPVTLGNRLREAGTLERVGGMDYIGFLLDAIPTADNVGYHAGIVKEWSTKRNLLDALTAAASELRDGGPTPRPAGDIARSVFGTLTPYTLDDDVASEGFLPISKTIYATMEGIERRAQGETGLLTGYAKIDAETGGIFDGEVLLLCGAEGMGKTASALNVGFRMAQRTPAQGGGAGAIVSAEMTRDAVQRFGLAWTAGIDSRKLRSGALRDTDFPRLAHAAGQFAQLPIWISDQAEPSVTDVIARCTALKAQHPEIRWVIVDFLQLIHLREKGVSEAVELKRVAYALKGMAKRLKVAVIAPVQVNTKDIEDMKDPRPRLKDLQGSSGMRQAADFVVLLYRPAVYAPLGADPREMEWNFAKVREAAPFLARMAWDGPTRRIDEWRTA